MADAKSLLAIGGDSIGTAEARRRSAGTGWVSGLIGVLIFSGSLPATRVAVQTFDPVFLTLARAALAGLAGLALLALLRAPAPRRADLPALAVVALGVVLGFPLLSAYALRTITSAQALIFIGLLPVATAFFGVALGGERPRPAFWIFSAAGAAIVAAYALDHGAAGSLAGDGLMLAAVLACGLGYAEGGRLSRRLGGWQVICWALALALPAALPSALLDLPASAQGIGAPALIALGYVAFFSMLIGFVFWYRGLAAGGIASIGQLQLLQPFFGLALAAAILHEPVGWPLVGAAAAVILCVAGARRYARPAAGVAAALPAR